MHSASDFGYSISGQLPSAEMAAPMLDVVGVGKTHGQRAVRWLRNRSILACYDPKTLTLRAPETKLGAARTYELMHAAIDATDR